MDEFVYSKVTRRLGQVSAVGDHEYDRLSFLHGYKVQLRGGLGERIAARGSAISPTTGKVPLLPNSGKTSDLMTQGMLPQHSFPRMDASVQSESSCQSRNAEHLESRPRMAAFNPAANLIASLPLMIKGTKKEPMQSIPMVGDVGGGPAEDGYNWRKYGQKQVKGSEYREVTTKCTYI
ncbi:hypothetical protein MLD38_000865 [Melastoma candidum]|uniref:Uncharacterized protein n=1 Tax=Melastoma candidum TaxID=119954 RepID=A0ACB9SAQ6_9MYRT|nr:hypothetical protein MLD38_000865 [Melastoma candidum]